MTLGGLQVVGLGVAKHRRLTGCIFDEFIVLGGGICGAGIRGALALLISRALAIDCLIVSRGRLNLAGCCCCLASLSLSGEFIFFVVFLGDFRADFLGDTLLGEGLASGSDRRVLGLAFEISILVSDRSIPLSCCSGWDSGSCCCSGWFSSG